MVTLPLIESMFVKLSAVTSTLALPVRSVFCAGSFRIGARFSEWTVTSPATD